MAHSFGHIGDLLRTLALSKEMEDKNLLDILYIVKEKIAIHDYVFINEEAERLTTSVLYIIEREILKEEEIKNWINSFKNLKLPESYPEVHYFKENIKNFLRSLYFRLKYKGLYDYLADIENTLNHHNSFFNNLNY
jgi:hypothetical protein